MVYETVNNLQGKTIKKHGNIHQKCVTANKSIVNALMSKGKEIIGDGKDNVTSAIDDLFNTMTIYKDSEVLERKI